jgi:predicted DNA-binding ribbon-helix-helix protein
MKRFSVRISELAYRQLKEAAERDGTTITALTRPAVERAAQAAALAHTARGHGVTSSADRKATEPPHEDGA